MHRPVLVDEGEEVLQPAKRPREINRAWLRYGRGVLQGQQANASLCKFFSALLETDARKVSTRKIRFSGCTRINGNGEVETSVSQRNSAREAPHEKL